MDRYIKINSADNVAVAVHPLSAGETVEVDGLRLTLAEDIPAGHKFALIDLHTGDNVIKYGFPIGHLTTLSSGPIWKDFWNTPTLPDSPIYRPPGINSHSRGTAGATGVWASATRSGSSLP